MPFVTTLNELRVVYWKLVVKGGERDGWIDGRTDSVGE